jgi:hypothetical protein
MQVDRNLCASQSLMFTEAEESAPLDIQRHLGSEALRELLATIRRLGLIPGLVEIRVYPLKEGIDE